MNLQEIENIVTELNGDYFDKGYEDYFPFELATVGCVRIIEFCNFQIWNSEDDPRGYVDESEEEREDLEMYLRKESAKLVRQLYQAFVI